MEIGGKRDNHFRHILLLKFCRRTPLESFVPFTKRTPPVKVHQENGFLASKRTILYVQEDHLTLIKIILSFEFTMIHATQPDNCEQGLNSLKPGFCHYENL